MHEGKEGKANAYSSGGDGVGKANTTAQTITKNGGKAIAVVGDILDDSYLQKLVKQTAEFGDGKIHIIVNNAGFTWDGVIHKVFIPTNLHFGYVVC